MRAAVGGRNRTTAARFPRDVRRRKGGGPARLSPPSWDCLAGPAERESPAEGARTSRTPRGSARGRGKWPGYQRSSCPEVNEDVCAASCFLSDAHLPNSSSLAGSIPEGSPFFCSSHRSIALVS